MVEGEPSYWHPESGHPQGGFGHKVFIDGSCMFRALGEDFARAGWAVTEVDEDGSLIAAFYGPLPALYPQTAQAGEHYALMMAAGVIPADATVHSDCSGVVKGVQKGKEWSPP